MLQDLDDKLLTHTETYDDFTVVQKAVQMNNQNGRLLNYYPVHPSRVKRSLIHWHSLEVTSLSFTSCGNHLLSGGLEGVLVKWDLTECFGGPRERRFLPHLGAPIRSISSPGGVGEDTITVTFENNVFHILSGAFEQIYSEQGFLQIPKRWNSNPNSIFPQSLTLIDIPIGKQNLMSTFHTNKTSHTTLALTNGGMGNLQLINFDENQSNVQKLEISRQACVPRDYTSRLPIVYTEIFLIAQLKSNDEFVWIVTYERLQPDKSNCTIDDQSRITWWQCFPNIGVESQTGKQEGFEMKKFANFIPIDTYSMAHFNCPAVHMQFVPTERKHLFVLLKDYRLVVWSNNSNFAESSEYSPWILTSCHQLNCFKNMQSTWSSLKYSPQCSTISIGESVENWGNNYLIISSGYVITLFNWHNVAGLDLTTPCLSMDLVAELSANFGHDLQLDTIYPTTQPVQIYDPTFETCFVIQTIRGRRTQPSHNSPKTREKGALRETKCGLVVVLQVGFDSISTNSNEKVIGAKLECVKSDLLVNCIAKHDTKSWIALGLECTGNVSIYELATNDRANIQLNCLFTLIIPSSYPLCDRQIRHRAGRQTKSKQLASNKLIGTRIVALEFVTNQIESPQLVGLIDTVFGCESGRRDVIWIGGKSAQRVPCEGEEMDHHRHYHHTVSPCKKPYPLIGEHHHEEQQRPGGGILHLAKFAPQRVVDSNLNEGVKRFKRNTHKDAELEETLRQISQYPIYTAPPPEQLFCQLMQKPDDGQQQ